MQGSTKKFEGILMKLSEGVGHGPRRKQLDFNGNLDSSAHSGSSGIVYHQR